MPETPSSTTTPMVASTLGAQLETASRGMIERLRQSGSFHSEAIREQITAVYAFVADVATSRPLDDISVITIQDYLLAVRRWRASGIPDEAITAIGKRIHWFFDQVVEHESSPYLPSPVCNDDPAVGTA